MPVKGDFGALADLVLNLKAVAAPAFRNEVNDELAGKALELIDMGFRTSSDPEGEIWDPLKVRRGLPLLDTGFMRRSFGRGPISSGRFLIRSVAPYVGTHQDGAIITGPGIFPIFKDKGGRGSGFVRRGVARKVRWVPYDMVEIPQRQMVPEGSLPPRWRAVFERTVDHLLRRRMGLA